MLDANLFFDFDRNIINAGVTIWDDCAHAGGGHFERMLWPVYYMIHQNILWNGQYNLMHVTAIL